MTTITNLFDRIEAAYDAFPRVGGARTEDSGPFVVFVQEGPSWPYYARPRLGTTAITPADVEAVLARQLELDVPRAIEWVDDVTPALLPAVRELGLPVLLAPLMVLDHAALPTTTAAVTVSLLDPDATTFADDLAISSAVAHVGFGAGGTAVGPAGPAERDAAVKPLDAGLVDRLAASARRGERAEAVVRSGADGIVARGATQAALGAVEIVGVATLPSARRRGLAAALSARLAHEALETGHDLVFLAAADDAVARVYGQIGFRRVGTSCILELP